MTLTTRSAIGPALALAMVLGPTTGWAEPIVIVVPRPVTGAYAEIGLGMGVAARVVASSASVPVEIRETACPPDGRWPADTRVDAIIGQTCRGETDDAVGAAPIRIHVSIGEPFTARRPRGLRVPVATQPAATVLIDAIAATASTDAVVALVHDRSQLARTWADTLVSGLSTVGRPIARRLTIAGAQRTFDVAVADLRTAGVTDLALVAFPTEAAALVTELKSALPHLRVYAPDLLASADFARLAGSASAGVRVVRQQTMASLVRTSPDARSLAAALEAAGVTPSPPALHLAAALDLYLAATVAAGSTDPSKVRAALGEYRTTRLGPLRFESTSDVRLPAWAMYVWTDGRLEPAP